jgi:hypothetical protein
VRAYADGCAKYVRKALGRGSVVGIEGAQGELIDRLIEILNDDAEWYSLGIYAATSLGGSALERAVPDSGAELAPDTVGWWVRQFGEFVSRDEYFELIQDRFVELVNHGDDEASLVRRVRDEVRAREAILADVGEVNRQNAETKAGLERAIEDPAELAAFRAQLETSGQEVPSDAEIIVRLRKMAGSKILQPISADDALGRWAMLNGWDERVAASLTDEIIEEWQRLHHT